MTLFSFLSCGSSVAPPKSPLPYSGPNGIKSQPQSQEEEDSQSHEVHRVQESRLEDKADKAFPTDKTDKAIVIQTSKTRSAIDCTARRELNEAEAGSSENVVAEKTSKNSPKKAPKGQPEEEDQEIVAVFGDETWTRIISKAWDDRAKAVQGVREKVESGKLGETLPPEFFVASCHVVQALLADRVMPVYLGALELSRVLLVDFAPRYDLPASVVEAHADLMIPGIVEKTCDRNTRSIEATYAALMSVARSFGCRCVMVHALGQGQGKDAGAAIRGRLELLEKMIDEFGFSKNSGVSLSAVMGWVRPHLEAADDKVRNAAVEVTVSCYVHKGERTSQYVANLKPALQKVLAERFLEADRSGVKPAKKKKNGSRTRNNSNLPALKGQQGQRLTSRSSTRSTSSSGSGTRSSNSAGSIGAAAKRMAPMSNGLPCSPSSSIRSPVASRMPVEPDLLSPLSGLPGVMEDDLLDREDEAFMKELESLEMEMEC